MTARITLRPAGFGAFSNTQGAETIRLPDGTVLRRGEDGLYYRDENVNKSA